MTPNEQKISILFVDDEPFVLQGLKRLFRGMNGTWDMHFAESGKDALDLMTRENVNVVVADMRMPEMNGVQLLTRVMRESPETIRMILSGHVDQDLTLWSVKCAHQHMTKPCDPQFLIHAIDRAFRLQNALKSEVLRKAVASVKSLPSVPRYYAQLNDVLCSPHIHMREVGDIVVKDLAMTAKVLQLVNSAFFALQRRMTDIYQAISYLGIDTLQALVLCAEVFHFFKTEKIHKDYSVEEISRHAAHVAQFARLIVEAEGLDKKMAEDAYIGGLMHDIGQLVLLQNAEKYKEVMELIRREGWPYVAAEREVFQASHSEIGGYLLGLWGLPNSIVEAAVFHHSPSMMMSAEFRPVTAVHVANAFFMEETLPADEMSFKNLDYPYLESLQMTGKLPGWVKLFRNFKQGIFDEGQNSHR